MQISDFPELPAVLQQAVLRALTAQYDGQLFEADRLYQQIVRRKPLHPLMANTAAGFFLLKGDFATAWNLFRHRLDLPYYTHRRFAKLPQPMWTGETVPEGRLLIFCDMGLGDTILLARFLPQVLERVGSLALQVNPGTGAFWQRRWPQVEVRERDDPFPDCDMRLNMFCLPRLLGADVDTLPEPGYLQASEEERAFWRARLSDDRGLKVGLNWQGNPDHVRDAERSIPISALKPMIEDAGLRTSGVRFYSLQLHDGHDDADDLVSAGAMTSLSSEMSARDPLEASAALVEELDLVITIDSALANLAGAIDRPFWLPTYKVPDWRWATYPDLELENPQSSPWFNAQCLYRCAERGDWQPMIRAMTDDLARLTAEG